MDLPADVKHVMQFLPLLQSICSMTICDAEYEILTIAYGFRKSPGVRVDV